MAPLSWKMLLQHNDVLLAVGMVLIVAMMLIPLPSMLLDVLLTVNIALAVTVLLVTLYTREPLQYSTFPTILLVATLFSLNITTASAQANTEALRVCWEAELKPPYLMHDNTGEITGITVDMVEAILKNQEKPIKHLLKPWKRCLHDIQAGTVDVVPNASYKPKRAEFSHYSSPLYATNLVLFFRRIEFLNRPKVSSLEALSQYRLGGVHGFNYSFYNDKVKMDTSAKTRTALINMLRAGRFNFAVAQWEVIANLSHNKEVNLEGLDSIPDPVKSSKEYHILVSKKLKDGEKLVEFINQHIDEYKNNDVFKGIYSKYLGQ